jgi:hypothetical protein
MAERTAAQQIDGSIKQSGDWRGEQLARLRAVAPSIMQPIKLQRERRSAA